VKKRYQEYSDKATSGQMYMFGSDDSGSHRGTQVTTYLTRGVEGSWNGVIEEEVQRAVMWN